MIKQKEKKWTKKRKKKKRSNFFRQNAIRSIESNLHPTTTTKTDWDKKCSTSYIFIMMHFNWNIKSLRADNACVSFKIEIRIATGSDVIIWCFINEFDLFRFVEWIEARENGRMVQSIKTKPKQNTRDCRRLTHFILIWSDVNFFFLRYCVFVLNWVHKQRLPLICRWLWMS